MLSKDHKLKRMIEVARLYYEDGKSQNEIAKKLGISRPLVSVILSEAKDQGIVTVTINDTRISAEQIADRIKNIYKISDISIVPTGRTTASPTRRWRRWPSISTSAGPMTASASGSAGG